MATIIRRLKLGRSSVKGISAFSKTGIGWVRSDKRLPPDDLYIRWGCTSDVPGERVLNSAAAIHQVNAKGPFRKTLSDAGLSPTTWFDIKDVPDENLVRGVIVRPYKHAQGRRTHLCHTDGGLIQAVMNCGRGYYISDYIQKVAEYRVAIVQGRAVWVVQKTPGNPEDVAWNVARGGRFDNIRWKEWPLKVVRTAIEAFNLSSLDFGGVDVMVDAEGKAYVLEINSAPSLTSPYRQECFAKAFDYIIMNNKERIPLIEGRGGYTKFIHPAIEPEAKLIG